MFFINPQGMKVRCRGTIEQFDMSLFTGSTDDERDDVSFLFNGRQIKLSISSMIPYFLPVLP